MAWVAPSTRAAGYTAGTAVWNQDVVDNPTWLYTPPFAAVYHNTTQSVSIGAITALAMNSETADTDTMHDNVTNNSRLTATTAGVYLITGYAFTASASVGAYSLQLVFNSHIIYVNQVYNPTAATSMYLTIGGFYKLAAADYVQLFFYNGGSGSVTIAANPTFSMQWIGSGA